MRHKSYYNTTFHNHKLFTLLCYIYIVRDGGANMYKTLSITNFTKIATMENF